MIFTCTVTGDMSGTTIWRVNDSSKWCTLPHVSTGGTSCSSSEGSHAFTAIPGTEFGTSATSYSSTLSGTATSALNGTLVECFGPAVKTELWNRVGMGTILIVG